VIIDLQRRLAEAGRIRIGHQVPTDKGTTRPEKLSTFRLTSRDRVRIDSAAEVYGGKVAPWASPDGQQWEVVTTRDWLSVIVPPADMAFSMFYELWSAGGCKRRCDGAFESISDGVCICDPDERECSLHTRLSVMLADLPGLGVWRIDTQGWNAAVELSAAVQVMQAAAGRGVLLPGRLRLEQRSVKRPGANGAPQTRRFAVPVLDVDVTPAQLLSGGIATPMLTASPQEPVADAAHRLAAPNGDVLREQMRAVDEPTAKKRRRNAAVPIPATGVRPRTVDQVGPEGPESKSFGEGDAAAAQAAPPATSSKKRTRKAKAAEPQNQEPHEPSSPPRADQQTGELLATAAQIRKLMVLAKNRGYTDEQRHEAAGVASFKHLTKDRASKLIDEWDTPWEQIAKEGGAELVGQDQEDGETVEEHDAEWEKAFDQLGALLEAAFGGPVARTRYRDTLLARLNVESLEDLSLEQLHTEAETLQKKATS
jgi:recombination directionality factor gp3-like protein